MDNPLKTSVFLGILLLSAVGRINAGEKPGHLAARMGRGGRLKGGSERARTVAFRRKGPGSELPLKQEGLSPIAENRKDGIILYSLRGKDADRLLEDVDPGKFEELPAQRAEGGVRVFSSDRVTVQLRPGSGRPDLAGLLDELDASVLPHRFRQKGRIMVKVPGADQAVEAAAALGGSPFVSWARVDSYVPTREKYLPNDTDFIYQWHLHNTGQGGSMTNRDVYAERAWDITRGATAVVAVLDDGFDLAHSDLGPSIFNNTNDPVNLSDDDSNGYTDDWRGWDFADNDNDPSATATGNNHGTAVAGLLCAFAGDANGVAGLANQCKMLPVRITDGLPSISEWVAAIEYAASLADVLSISYFIMPDPQIHEALNYALVEGRGGKGCVVFAALGNDGVMRRYSNDLAAAPEVVSVSGSSNYDRRSWFADYGPATDLVAPTGGGSLSLWTTDRTPPEGYNTGSTHEYFTGTSASCPLAAAVAALMISQHPGWTGLKVRAAIQSSCDTIDHVAHPYSGRGWNSQYGYGRINAWASLLAAEPTADPWEPDNSGYEATPVIDGEMQFHSLGNGSDMDWVSFSAPTNMDIRLTLVGTTNAYLRLYNSDTNEIALQDTNYPSWTRLTVNGLSAGKYFASVESPGAVPVPEYGLHFGILNLLDDYETGDTSNGPPVLQPREMQYRSLYPTGDVDWASFTLSSATDVSIYTMGDANGDTVLSLMNSNYVVIATNDDLSGETYFSGISTQLNSGKYYVAVREFDYLELPSYQLLLESSAMDVSEPDNTSTQATPIQSGERLNRTLYPSNDMDWFCFTVTNKANALVLTDTVNPGLVCDTVMRLYKDEGTLSMVATNNDGNNLNFSAIYAVGLDPGTYYIQVQGYDSVTTCPNYFVALDVFTGQTVIDGLEIVSNGLELVWMGDATYSYAVLYTNELRGTQDWAVATNLEGRAGRNTWTDMDTGSTTQRFYRIRTN